MSEHPKKRWGGLQWGVVLVVALLGCLWLSAQFKNAARAAPQMKAVSNAKQIIIAMKQYAARNAGMYPDSIVSGSSVPTANRLFRGMFKGDIVTDECIFGSPGSRFIPDGVIGAAPDFVQAVQAGENHWMILKGQTDASTPRAPLVIENALNTAWPPRWDVSANAGQKPGRAWKGGFAVIGRNDGSVEVVRLQPDGTPRSGNAASFGGDWTERLPAEEVARWEYAPVEK